MNFLVNMTADVAKMAAWNGSFTLLHDEHKHLQHEHEHGAQAAVIDLLQIDTEGHDPLVISGAVKLIQEKKVRCIAFEYHRVGVWKTIHWKYRPYIRSTMG